MKKAYSKPEIYFDSFELSSSIAAGCEYKANFAAGACALADPAFGNVYLDGISGCAVTQVDGAYNGICYHVPSDNTNLFSS